MPRGSSPAHSLTAGALFVLAERVYRLMVIGSPGKGAAPGEPPAGVRCAVPTKGGETAVTECEHGHPQPSRCALCRQREKQIIEPWRYQDTRAPRRTGMPRPIWFDALVQEAREKARNDG